MINHYATRVALAALLCIPAALNADELYSSIHDRQEAVRAHYQALVNKWKTALDNPSDATIQFIISQKKNELKAQFPNALNLDEQGEIKGMLNALKTFPMQFICNELDADIKAIVTLNETARILDMPQQFDLKPFQNLRAAIDTLPCMEREQGQQQKLAKATKYVFGSVGAVLLASHFSIIPDLKPLI